MGEVVEVVAEQHKPVGWGWFLLALLIPLVGIVGGIVQAARGNVGPALALWATSAVAWIVAGALFA